MVSWKKCRIYKQKEQISLQIHPFLINYFSWDGILYFYCVSYSLMPCQCRSSRSETIRQLLLCTESKAKITKQQEIFLCIKMNNVHAYAIIIYCTVYALTHSYIKVAQKCIPFCLQKSKLSLVTNGGLLYANCRLVSRLWSKTSICFGNRDIILFFNQNYWPVTIFVS